MKSFCPLCNSSESVKFGICKTNSISIKHIDKEYEVVKCNNCQFYYVAPEISFDDAQWAELYNSEYFTNQSDWLIRKRAEELSERLYNASNFISSSKEIKLLDIGTGEGNLLIEGFKRGWDVTGIDIVDNRTTLAKNPKINFIKAKFLEQEFPENTFDLIYLDSVLEHVLQPKEYLLKAKRILKKGGIIYIGVPNEDCLFNDIRKIVFYFIGRKKISTKIKPFDSPYHVVGFNITSLKFLFNKTNLKIKYLRNFGRKFEFLSSSPANKAFWISLFFLLPIEFLGKWIGRDIYYEVYLTKE
jgi:ubiquinone/menaquinone biosynthesis C-methylase UbiE